MKIHIDGKVNRELKKIKKANKKLSGQIEKKLFLFSQNHRHPSLRIHKLTGTKQNTWSISINMSIRMVYILLDEDTALFVKIGIHDEVYRK